MLGFMAGLVVGLAIAVVVAIFVTRAPVPFLNKAKRSADRLEAPPSDGRFCRFWRFSGWSAGISPAKPWPRASRWPGAAW